MKYCCFLCFYINLYILPLENIDGAEIPLLPQRYQLGCYHHAWPDFCFEHMLLFPLECSDRLSADDNRFFFSLSEHPLIVYLKNDYRIPKISRVVNKGEVLEYFLDEQTLSLITPYQKLIPRYKHECGFTYCKRCNSPIMLKLGLKKGFPVVYNQCQCSFKWYTDEDNMPSYWEKCHKRAICSKYFDIHCVWYSRFLIEHLVYCADNPTCQCYWPQTSKRARDASTRAHTLTQGMIMYTALSELIGQEIPDPAFPYFINRSLQGVAAGLVVNAFFFTDYHQIYNDLARWIENNEPSNEKALLGLERIQTSLHLIGNEYLDLYTQCLDTHPHPKIYYERGMLYFERGMNIEAAKDMNQFIQLSEEDPKHTWNSSNTYLTMGTLYADLGLYERAIEQLSNAIECDPQNKEIYFERASCYLENGDFAKSIEDFLLSDYRSTPTTNSDLWHLEFAKGFIEGATHGSKEALSDFVPSTLASLYGVGHALWSFALHPQTVSKEFIDSAFQLIEYIQTVDALETLKETFPKIANFIEGWRESSPEEQGKRLGNFIGKYGIEIFAIESSTKVVKALRSLKKANAALTIESLIQDAEKAQTIHKYSKRWWKKTKPLIEELKKDGQHASKELSKLFKSQSLTEYQIRKILHTAGFKTFVKPKGLPTNCIVSLSKKGGGMVYRKSGTTIEQNVLVRVMPGNPHSPNPWQRKPYVVQRRGNGALSNSGKLVHPRSETAHIPISEFYFQQW